MNDDPLARALAGYGEEFEQRLLDHIVNAIIDASLIDDGTGHHVLALRLGETAQALTTPLACVLALSPSAAHNAQAIKQTSQSFRRKLSARIGQARSDPQLGDFLRRSFNHTDRTRGGRA